MDSSPATVVPDVEGGDTEVFTITPTYWVAVYHNLQKGEVISSVGVVATPIKLQFASGQTTATVTLGQDGNRYTLGVTYS